ncbi:hypothetical protein FSP39_020476 [Pinctada imbricata]|uniref:PDZ domain-containing protein n=1 Tax=Pinctada imbricata TaxID=66713 RepID=A0AA88XN92_PINIB|nr:hypothetical protein FSP39_020476 [Pinctada imbricata]
MDGCLDLTPVKIPRPQFYTYVELAIMERGDKEATLIENAGEKYGNVHLEIIPIYKTKPTLGLAVEGGVNTGQPIPRVINIQPGGSAHASGRLRVGHVILEVNGQSLAGMQHLEAARTIAEAFKRAGPDGVELLVTDKNIQINQT